MDYHSNVWNKCIWLILCPAGQVRISFWRFSDKHSIKDTTDSPSLFNLLEYFIEELRNLSILESN